MRGALLAEDHFSLDELEYFAEQRHINIKQLRKEKQTMKNIVRLEGAVSFLEDVVTNWRNDEDLEKTYPVNVPNFKELVAILKGWSINYSKERKKSIISSVINRSVEEVLKYD